MLYCDTITVIHTDALCYYRVKMKTDTALNYRTIKTW